METAENRGVIAALEAIAADAPETGLALGEFLQRLGDRAFAVVFFALAIPVCIPFLYGVPQVIALPMLALALQMAAGRDEPWMPEKFARRTLGKATLQQMAHGGRKWFGWIEALARPRFLVLSGDIFERVIGGVFCLFCLSILTPLPLTNSTPGLAIAIASLGLLTRDGLMILAGLVLGVAWIALLVIGGPTLIYLLLGLLRDHMWVTVGVIAAVGAVLFVVPVLLSRRR